MILRNIKARLYLLLPPLSGLLLATTFPPLDWNGSIWISFVPLLFFWSKNISLQQKLGGGFVTGLLYYSFVAQPFLGVANWAWADFGTIIADNRALILFWVWLCAGMGSAIGLGAVAYALHKLKNIPLLLLFPFTFVVSEWLRAAIFFHFTWGHIGYAVHDLARIRQLAGIIGVYGVSFFICTINVLVLLLIKHILLKKYYSAVVYTCVIALVYAGSWFYGVYRIQENSAPPMNAVILPNAAASAFSPLSFAQALDTALAGNPQLVILPENYFGVPYDLAAKTFVRQMFLLAPMAENAFSMLLNQSLRHPDVLFIMGLHTIENDQHFNSAVLLQDGALRDTYHKHFLFPLAEKIPGRAFLENFWTANAYRIAEGSGKQVVRNREHTIGVLMCSEAMFPQLAQNAKKQGSDFLVIIGNDAIAQNEIVRDELLAMAQFRAVETRQWIFRATTNGYATIINTSGDIEKNR